MTAALAGAAFVNPTWGRAPTSLVMPDQLPMPCDDSSRFSDECKLAVTLDMLASYGVLRPEASVTEAEIGLAAIHRGAPGRGS